MTSPASVHSLRVAADPEADAFRVFRSALGTHVLLLARSQVFDVSPDLAEALQRGDPEARQLLEDTASTEANPSLADVPEIPPQSISLNLTSACNLGCSYCYADRGSFGGAQSGVMSQAVALAAVDRVLDGCDRRAPVTIGFLGGEPFLQRTLLHEVVAHAARRGVKLGLVVRFSVTTNGTLFEPDDLALLREHRFAVTVSIDGGRTVHDRKRRLLHGPSSFDLIARSLAPLLERPGQAQLSARATVTRDDFALGGRYDDIVALGFRDVGFSPVRVGAGALLDADWPAYLKASLALAERELERLIAHEHTSFSNLAVALRQIHRGAAAPYPCGAGGGYFSVSTRGSWYACHRAIGDAAFELGSSAGLDLEKRRAFLASRHVHAQSACRTCWARYLCSGSCHQEVAARGDASCDFVRGWLEFCLAAYCRASAANPAWFRRGSERAAERPS